MATGDHHGEAGSPGAERVRTQLASIPVRPRYPADVTRLPLNCPANAPVVPRSTVTMASGK
jgi:hypothetical protein